jgi:hypothetical protein
MLLVGRRRNGGDRDTMKLDEKSRVGQGQSAKSYTGPRAM